MSTTADLSPHNSGRDSPGARSARADRDMRRAHEARTKFWRVLIVTTFFVVVLSGNLFVGAVMVVKALRTSTGETAASTRIGRMTFPLFDGIFCRHVLIDNETVQTKEEKVSRCDGQDPASSGGSSRFSWGGR
jgi:hypothetical protein